MERVATVVVTYNRKKLLKELLEALLNQTRKPDHIFVVNNASTDGTEEMLKEYEKKYDTISTINLNENLGGSGGFHIGVREVICKGGFDWIWMMDDDALPAKNALETLFEYYNSLPENRKMKIGVLQNKRIFDREHFEMINGKRFKLKAKPRYFGTFVGFLVKTKIVEEVGFPRGDFFIYGDDVEYGFRIRKHGYKMKTVIGSYIYHPNWASPVEYMLKKRKLISKGILKIQPWRYYYVFRNGLLMFRLRPFLRLFVIAYQILDIISWATIDRKTVEFALKGMKDGLKGISGKEVEPGQKTL